MEEVGNIRLIEQAYESVKEHIAYEAFNYFVITVVVMLLLSRSYEEYNEYIKRESEPPTILAIWGHMKGYVFMTVLVMAMPAIFNVIEASLSELSSKLIEGFGGDSASKASDSLMNILNGETDIISDKYADASGFDYLPLIYDSIINGLGNALSLFVAPVGILIFKYTYTFAIICRFMWLLMLEVAAPIAIICLIHPDTKQYFQAWIKNMFLCYLMLPLFLLADLFSNAVALELLRSTSGEVYSGTGWVVIILAVIIKLRVFSVVSSRISQLI